MEDPIDRWWGVPRDMFYIYTVYVDGVLKYIGKGVGDRYLHPISGLSHVKELNKHFYTGCHIYTCIVEDELTEDDALNIESDYLSFYKSNKAPLYNKRYPSASRTPMYEEEVPEQWARRRCSCEGQLEIGILPNIVHVKTKDMCDTIIGEMIRKGVSSKKDIVKLLH